MNPKFPVFIPTKGRADSRLTIKMFDELAVPYTIFVERQEYDVYSKHVAKEDIHVLPHQNEGVTVTRNYIWDYAEANGYEYYWSFDDNIDDLYRFNRNLKVRCYDGTILAVIEDFAQRYENLPICGMNYEFFIIRKDIRPPYNLNTRIYSNMLIQTNAKDQNGNKFRFDTFFNEDTDLCLRVLKAGLCTVLFNAFLIKKITTMVMEGGNTAYYEKTNKRLEFVQELQKAHPDVVKLTEKFSRWHHQVDYSGFTQQLRRRPGIIVPQGVNNFGMILEEKVNGQWIKRAENNGDPEAE